MALTRRLDLFLNNERTPGNVLLSSLADRTSPSAPVLIEADKFLVRLRFCDLANAFGGVATTVELPEDNVIVLAGKKVRGTGASLFKAENFTTVTEGAVTYYQAILNLNTVALAAAFSSSEQQITVWVDVELQAPASDGGVDPDRITYQFPVTVLRQAYAGEGAPSAGDPVYPAPELLVVKQPANGAYRFVSDGGAGIILQLKNGTTDKFHSLFVTGAEGAETLAIGPGVV